MRSILAWRSGLRSHERPTFSKRIGFQKKVIEKLQKIGKIKLKWVPVAPFGLILNQNRSQCIQEAFGSPPGPWGGHFWPKMTKTDPKRTDRKNPYISPYQTPDQPLWAAAILIKNQTNIFGELLKPAPKSPFVRNRCWACFAAVALEIHARACF